MEKVILHLSESKLEPKFPFAFVASLELADKQQKMLLGEADSHPSIANLKKASAYSKVLSSLMPKIRFPQPVTALQAFEVVEDREIYKLYNISVELPSWWNKRKLIKSKIKLCANKFAKKLTSRDIISFNAEKHLDKKTLTKQELKEISKIKNGLLKLRGQWVEVTEKNIQGILTTWQEAMDNKKVSFLQAIRLLNKVKLTKEDKELSQNVEICVDDTCEILKNFLKNGLTKSVKTPVNLRASLRPYQQAGYSWLCNMSDAGLGSLLADDMGLGKTIQVIAFLLNRKDKKIKNNLIICPSSLVPNWLQEFEKFAPSLKIYVAHAMTKGFEIDKPTPDCDIVLTTYSMIKKSEILKNTQWDNIILDEAQAIKTPDSSQTEMIKCLKGEVKIAMTGTPIENSLFDMWSIFDFVNPSLLGTLKEFDQYVKSLSPEKESLIPLRNFVKPFILRRVKTDKRIIKDLPPKTEKNVFCGLSRMQVALYQDVVKDLKAKLANTSRKDRAGEVLSSLTKLKQICNHPSHYIGNRDYREDESGKFMTLRKLAQDLKNNNERLVVFTQYKEIIPALNEILQNVYQEKGEILHGSLPLSQRKQAVKKFQSPVGSPYFILSLKAGGTGLTLTNACHLVHFDRWWNPAIENQASDRVYRIGQTRKTTIHKFLTIGTLEEKIDKILTQKNELSNSILEQGCMAISSMSDKEILSMISLSDSPISCNED